MTHPVRDAAAARIEALTRLAEREDENVEALADDVPETRLDALTDRVFAMLDESEAKATAAGEASSFAPERGETSSMTSRDIDDPVSRFVRDGAAFVRFSVQTLLKGPDEVADVVGMGFRRAGGEALTDRLVWRPSHLEALGDDATGDWTLYLEHRELGAGPEARPDIELRVDGRALDDDAVEIDYDAEDGVISIGFRLDEPFDWVDLLEEQEDRVIVVVATGA